MIRLFSLKLKRIHLSNELSVYIEHIKQMTTKSQLRNQQRYIYII